MKLVPEGELEYGRIKSEGKLLEIIPWLTLNGQPFMLPPVVYRVENWLLGFRDEHYIGGPQTYQFPARLTISGSNARDTTDLSFILRVMEDGDAPINAIATIDAESVRDIVSAIKDTLK